MNEAFQEALKQREKRKKREESKSSFSEKDFEVIHWLALQEAGSTPIRLIGNPVEFRQKPSDTKLVYRSKILSQEKKDSYFYVNWKQTTETRKGFEFESGDLDKKWILHRFLSDVQEVEWVKVEGKEKKQKEFINAGSPVYKKVESNKIARDLSNPYANKFYPSKIVLANVIDPSDLDFHKETNHSKLIASKLDIVKTDDGNQILYPKPGFPYTVYSAIIDNLVSKVGGWDFDIVVKRDVNGDPMYSVNHFSDFAVPSEVKAVCSDRDYMEQFKNLELYNLDEMYKVTSYTKLKYHLLPLFKEWDKENGNSRYAEELEELAEQEAEARNAEKEKAPKSIPTETPKESKPRERKAKEEKSKPGTTEDPKTLFPKLDSIDPEDKEWFFKTFSHVEDGKAVWKVKDDEGEKVQLTPCDHCGVELSSKLLQCPACGETLD